MKKLVALYALWFVSLSFAIVQNENPIQKLSKLMVKLEWDRPEPYYGSGFLWGVTKTHLFYVTTAHVFPESQDKIESIRAISPIKGMRPVEIQVVGGNPGYDVGIFRLKRECDDRASTQELEGLIRSALNWKIIEQKIVHIGILGTPDLTPDKHQHLKNILWKEELEIRSRWGIGPYSGDSPSEIPHQNSKLSSESVILSPQSECPQVFAEKCYQIPMLSWGYSGGVLLVSDRSDVRGRKVKITGIVSHYSPLSEVTYVIPMPVVAGVISQYVEERKKSNYSLMQRNDKTNTFEYVSNSRMKVTKGDLANKVVTNIFEGSSKVGGGESSGGGGESSGGGGESSGGGGESSGGGGESSGGGGESSGSGGEQLILKSTPHYILRDEQGHLTGLVNYDVLQYQVEHPELWHHPNNVFVDIMNQNPFLKGIRVLFNYQPGVQLDGGKVIHRFGNSPIININSFVSRYLKDSGSVRSYAYKDSVIPSQMALTKRFEGGLHTVGEIFEFIDVRSFAEYATKAIQKDPDKAWDLTVNEYVLLKVLAKRGETIKRKHMDMVSSRQQVTASGAISMASFERKDGQIVLKTYEPKFGMSILSFKDGFEQKGDYFFQYKGKCTLQPARDINIGETHPIEDSYGIINLQFNPTRKMYELKGVIAYPTPDWMKGYLDIATGRAIGYEAVYIPFESTKALPKMKTNPEPRSSQVNRDADNLPRPQTPSKDPAVEDKWNREDVPRLIEKRYQQVMKILDDMEATHSISGTR